eukprot:gnl/TRDRNA2_/TRDRNA2_44231_c0_seq1.p1 gnl/TRDRNA2_/TRDRNA2_44231_c0~~gnl/TRDRNA2_/TRDRNA2_44231_c0_seq1.p1  ORF type:complete len:474 (+),score=61.16 gnl/TRDRNA2_/TRDRNA2_44231_c0_seq1:125-1546(+)
MAANEPYISLSEGEGEDAEMLDPCMRIVRIESTHSLTSSWTSIKRRDSQHGTSTMTASVVNLLKAIVGSGVLALPAGVTSFTDEAGVGIGTSLLVAAALGCFSAYCFWLIGRLCLLTKSSSYTELLANLCGKRLSRVAEGFIVANTGTACVLGVIIIGDLVRDLALLVGLEGLLASRAVLLIVVGLLVLVPLGLLRSFAALAPVAALGSLGMLYIVVFMGLRLIQEAYMPGGSYFADAPIEPSFGVHGTRWIRMFVLVSMFSTAYISHYNAPQFVHQLVDPTSQRFALVSGLGFGLSFLVMSGVMVFGFLTFGGASQGMILQSYALTDYLAAAARIALLVSVIAGFPFVLVAFRDGALGIFLRPTGADLSWKPERNTQNTMTVFLVIVITAIAIVIDDLGFLVAFGGAVTANAITYVFPALAALSAFGPHVQNNEVNRMERFEYVLNQAIVLLGIALAVVGASVTIAKEATEH